jgi:hypothetical protein
MLMSNKETPAEADRAVIIWQAIKELRDEE